MKVVFRIEKLKQANLLGARKHNNREQDTPNADPEKLNKNAVLVGRKDFDVAVLERIENERKKNNVTKKIRSDAVYAYEILLSASPEFFEKGIPKSWLKKSHNWLKEEFGEENIVNMTLHRDEKTPHLHVVVTPLENGRLNARKWTGEKNSLAEMQDRYHQHVKTEGLERGLRGSKTTHQTVKQFYEKINQALSSPIEDIELKKSLLGGYTVKTDDAERLKQLQQENEALRLVYIEEQKKNKALEKLSLIREKQVEEKEKNINKLKNDKLKIEFNLKDIGIKDAIELSKIAKEKRQNNERNDKGKERGL